MDRPGLDPAEHAAALRGLRRINRISGTTGQLTREIETLVRQSANSEALTVLDVACGGGDLVCDLARHARAKGWNVRLAGTDISEQALGIAHENAARLGLDIRFFRWNAVDTPLPGRFDVVISSLFLHHLSEQEVTLALRHMADGTNRLLLADDLIRSVPGYVLAKVGCHLLSRSFVVHFDGPVSVRSAFTVSEIAELAKAAGLPGCEFRKHWPRRYLLKWRPDR